MERLFTCLFIRLFILAITKTKRFDSLFVCLFIFCCFFCEWYV
nr:MAG TPA: hypothetical protein [Caudoviricetes sp.]